MARCLVTGHKGYIGSKLFKALQDAGHKVMGIDLEEDICKDVISMLAEGTDGMFSTWLVGPAWDTVLSTP